MRSSVDGALDVPEIKELIEVKLAEAKTAERVSASRPRRRSKRPAYPTRCAKALEDVADTQIKAKGRISRPTAAAGRQIVVDA